MVIAEIRDASIQNTIVNPKGLNICPDIPSRSASGINTTQVVIVPPMIDSRTIPLPSKAALEYSRKPTPFVERKQLSNTTMELSTIIPTPSTRELKVITFRENPAALMATSAVRMEIGMEVPTIREAFRSPKNNQIMIMETATAITMVFITELKDDLIISLLSSTTTISRFSSLAIRRSTTLRTALDASTSLLLCCFLMATEIVSRPL